MIARNPSLLFDEFLPDHGDLRHRPAPRQQAKVQEAEKESCVGFAWRRVYIIGHLEQVVAPQSLKAPFGLPRRTISWQ